MACTCLDSAIVHNKRLLSDDDYDADNDDGNADDDSDPLVRV